MRELGIALAVLLLMGGPGGAAHAQTVPSALRCEAETITLTAAGVVQSRALPYFVEVELRLVNRSEGAIRVDPARFVLRPDQGEPVAPASRDQVTAALRSPAWAYAGFYGMFTTGSVGVAVGVGPIDLQARAIDGRILKAVEIAPGVSLKGSVYFRPASWLAQFTLVLDGVGTGSGTMRPVELRHCQMPVRPLEPPAAIPVPPPGARTVALSARAGAGPVTVSVSTVELTRIATTLTVSVDNAADAVADLFVAIGHARLVDAAGITYAVRMLRSDLPDRVASRGLARGLLVFDPLPTEPPATLATLVLPDVWVGDATYDIVIALRL